MSFTDGAIFQGNTVEFTETVYQSDGVTPFNLTGCAIAYTGKLDPDSTVTVWNKSIGSDVIVSSPSTGVIQLWLRPADTSSLPAWSLIYNYVIVTDASNNVYTTYKFTTRLAV